MQSTAGARTVEAMGGMVTIKTESGACEAYVAVPEEGEQSPSLVLIHEIWGLTDHIRGVAERFAREGFLVVAPDILSDTGILKTLTPDFAALMQDPEKRAELQPKLREAMQPLREPAYAAGALKKLRACVDYCVAHVRGNGKVGALGFCFGGTYTWHLAMREARLDAAVPFYGQTPDPVDSVHSISCPVMAFYGEDDPGIVPSIPALERAMEQYGKEFTAIIYPGAKHAFFNDTNAFAYNAEAAKDAWTKATAFLHKELES